VTPEQTFTVSDLVTSETHCRSADSSPHLSKVARRRSSHQPSTCAILRPRPKRQPERFASLNVNSTLSEGRQCLLSLLWRQGTPNQCQHHIPRSILRIEVRPPQSLLKPQSPRHQRGISRHGGGNSRRIPKRKKNQVRESIQVSYLRTRFPKQDRTVGPPSHPRKALRRARQCHGLFQSGTSY
jgi:hypothetical protein